MLLGQEFFLFCQGTDSGGNHTGNDSEDKETDDEDNAESDDRPIERASTEPCHSVWLRRLRILHLGFLLFTFDSYTAQARHLVDFVRRRAILFTLFAAEAADFFVRALFFKFAVVDDLQGRHGHDQ